MLIHRDELARKVLEGEITSLDDLNAVLRISPETVSRITDAVIDKAKEWRNRPLEPIYAIVFMDALFLKLRVDGRVKNVAAYLMVGIDLEGRKECLGIWLGQSESAKYWLGVLNEFKKRGVNDVLIFAVDGLTGLPSVDRETENSAHALRCDSPRRCANTTCRRLAGAPTIFLRRLPS